MLALTEGNEAETLLLEAWVSTISLLFSTSENLHSENHTCCFPSPLVGNHLGKLFTFYSFGFFIAILFASLNKATRNLSTPLSLGNRQPILLPVGEDCLLNAMMFSEIFDSYGTPCLKISRWNVEWMRRGLLFTSQIIPDASLATFAFAATTYG